MTEPRMLHTRCPSCQAALDYDTDVTRHYECGTVGSFTAGGYTQRCLRRTEQAAEVLK